MQNRKLYDANDRSLCADRVRAKELCHAYNQLWPSDEAGKREILRRLLAKTGEDFCVTAPFWCDYGYNIRLGEHFYANHNLVILDCAAVTFGDHVFVAPNCGFYTAGHPIDAARRELGLEYAYPITVGDHVWIGGGVQVMPGVTIGSNVVIGGRKRRRPGHPERFGCCRQSLQGHSPNYGGRQTDLLGQIAPGCAAREKQDAESQFGGQAK